MKGDENEKNEAWGGYIDLKKKARTREDLTSSATEHDGSGRKVQGSQIRLIEVEVRRIPGWRENKMNQAEEFRPPGPRSPEHPAHCLFRPQRVV